MFFRRFPDVLHDRVDIRAGHDIQDCARIREEEPHGVHQHLLDSRIHIDHGD